MGELRLCLVIFIIISFLPLQANAQCKAFAGADQLVCPGDTVILGDTTAAGIGQSPISYSWSNGDTSANPQVVVWDTTQFILTITDDTGCSHSDTVVINTRPIPDTATFTFTPDGSCAPMTSNFSIVNPDTTLTYTWIFPGSSFDYLDTSYSFDGVGSGIRSFDVTLRVTDTFGCWVEWTDQVTIQERPNPVLVDPITNFTSCFGDTFTLTVYNNSVPIANITSYSLTWGDGTPGWSGATFPPVGLTHTYPALGVYPIQFTATGTNGCTYTRTFPVYNTTNPAIAVGSPGSTSGCAPRTFCFPLLNYQGNGSATYYIVNYGDGSPIETYPHPPPDTLCHTYDTTSCNQPGAPPIFPPDAFVFSITAVNPCDSTPAAVGGIKVYTKPEANFDIINDTGCFLNPYDFQNISISGFDNNCDSTDFFFWDFGDGTAFPVFSKATQTHTYAAPGEYVVTLNATDFCGSSLYIDTLCAQDTPVADFTLQPDTGCIPLQVDVTNQSSVLNDCGDYLMEWFVNYLGGGCDSGGAYIYRDSTDMNSVDPKFTFTTSGIYEVMLVVTNTCGQDTMYDTVVAQQEPLVSLSAVPNFCDTALVTPNALTNICQTDTGFFSWSFVGGIPASSPLPEPDSIYYQNPGNYEIILTVQNVCGTVADTADFFVFSNPEANFTATEPCFGNPMSFTDQSIAGPIFGAPPVIWSWNFGDGGSSSNQNPSRNYASYGPFTVDLIITDSNGCVDDTMIDVLVNPLPLPDFSWTDVCLGDPMSFTNLSDFDSLYISSIVNYSWDFGDGAGSSNQQNPSYTYASAGNFNVVLSITDNNGCQDSIVHQVRVFDNPTANFSAPDVCIGDPTQFTNLSNNSLLGSPIVSWSWDFGDGSGTSVLQNPSYQYAAVGNYNVTLTITDSFGCTDDTTIQVVVNPLPDASYTYAPTTGCHPLTVQFTHTGSPGVTHLWYDNGAFVSNQANPLLTLTNASPIIDANHVIMHVVEAGTFCTDTIIDTVIVFPKPSANFNFTPASTCAPDTLKVNNTTQVKGPANYLWSVSSSAVSISNPNDPAPVFTFPDNQSGTDSTYTVTVIASSVDGCLDTFSRTITIYSRPVVSFTIDSTTCGPASLTPVNNSIGNGLNYSWSSAPGGSFSNPTLAQPQLNLPVSLNDSVIYTVILVITDVNACTDEDSAQVILYPKPTAAFAASNYDSCGDFTVQFSNLSTPNNGLETINDMSFIWDLGNGQSSNLQDPSAIYTNSGVTDSLYIVELIAISPHNCTDTIVDTITVYPNPVAQYNRTLQADCAPFILDSTIISLIDFPDANDNYQWFADGVSIGSGMTFPGFAMNSGPDTVIISLVATNVHGCQLDTFELEFYTIEQPVAGFTLPINAGCHPLSISPVDTSVSANSYSWFIDGQLVSNLQNPTLTFRNNSFTQDSIQTVTLIVTAGTGCSDTVDQLVTVYPKPQADFDFNPSSACAPATVGITDLSQLKGPGSYSWSAANSSVVVTGSNTANPTFSFPDNQSGVDTTYLITVILTSTDGCIDTAVDSITIFSRPVASFTVPDSTCGPATLTTTNSSTGNGLSYLWSINPAGTITTPAAINPTVDLAVSLLDSVIYSLQVISTDVNGCIDSASRDIILYPKPTAAFTASNTDSCGPLTVQFSNLSTPNNPGETIANMSFEWDFGNGQSSTAQDPNATFTNTGLTDSSYVVRLISITEHGCRDTIFDTITVYPNPLADFTATITVDCAPFVIDTSIISLNQYPNANDSYTWLVDGAIVGTGIFFPGYTIPNDGDTAVISLVAENIHGCQPDTLSINFITIENPVAGFTAPFYAGCHILSIPFTDTSTPGVNHNWYINGQLVSNVASPILDFYNNSPVNDSIQTVRLIVTAGSGCSDTLDRSVTVFPKPDAGFTFARPASCAGDTVSAFDTSLVKGPATYVWSVNSSAVTIANGNTANPTFSFPDNQSGTDSTYAITLIVTSTDGCSDTLSRNFVVFSRPVAAFTIDTANCGPANVSPVNNSLGNGLSFAWTLDPTAGINDSSLASPIFSLPLPLADSLLYEASLLITDVNGCVDSGFANTIVWPQPIAGFTTSNSDSCGPFTVSFTNTSDPNNFNEVISGMSFAWDFGDGGTSVLQDPVHTFTNTGLDDSVYVVQLIAFSEHGCADTVFDTITVFPNPVAQFNASYFLDCAPFVLDSNLISATDFPTANDNYTWLVDGVVIGTGLSFPGFTIPNDDDTVTVSLVAENIEGCLPDTLSLDFITIEDPVAGFTAIPTEGCSPLTVSFTDTSTAGVTWAWYIDGVLADTIQNPNFTFTNSSFTIDSFYQVDLIITAAGSGCSDTATQIIQVYNLPLVDAGPDFPICVNDSIFQILSGTPVGGFWTGTGITDSIGLFDPALAGIGFHSLTYTFTDSNGCIGQDSLTVEVLGLPFVDAGQDTTVCDQAIPVQLFGSPAGGIWSGPTITTGGNFTPSNLGIGSYTMFYAVTDTNGCTNTDSMQVTVIAPTFADAGLPDTLCLNALPDTIQGFSPAGGFWSGAGIIDANLGVFDPSLAGVGDEDLVYTFGVQTCLTRDTNTYHVWPLPQVDFTNSLTCIGDTTQFTDLSIANADSLVSWFWNFGDGGVDSIQNPEYIYAVTGVYNVTLTVTNSNGCTNDTVKAAVTNPLPNLNMTHPTLACEDDTIFFVLDTIDAANYTWYWGDGDSSTGPNPFHIFTNPGQYTIRVIATTAVGCTDSTTRTIRISDDPTAFFVPSPDSGCGPLLVDFFPIPPITPFGSYTYYWEFGQGDTVFTFIPPTITFLPGVNGDTSYTVEYRVYSQVCQSVDVHFENVVVSPIPIAAFTPDIDSGCHPLAVSINNQSRGLADSFFVNFGDGRDTIVTNLNNIPHVFSNTGIVDSTYTVTIFAYNDCGADTFSFPVTVFPNTVIADIQSLNPVGCQNDTFFFSNNSIGAFYIYYDFGDGSPILASTDSQVSHVFVDSGSFQVIQTVFSNDSCSTAQDTVTITVNGLLQVNAGQDTTVCNQAIPVQLFGLPVGGSWGDSLISTGGQFSPDSLPLGTTTFYYEYIHPISGCVNTDSMVVTTVQTVFADAGLDDTICIDNGVLNLNGGNPAGGFWTGTGLVDSFSGQFSPDSSGAGSFEVVYTYGVQTCLTRDTTLMVVHPLPIVDAGPDDTLCLNAGLFNLSTGSPPGATGVWTGTGVVDPTGIFDPMLAGAGDHVLTYTYTNPVTTCVNSDTMTMTVLPLPFVEAGPDTVTCDQAVAVQLYGLPPGGTWSGPFISPAGEFFPVNIGVGVTKYYYTVIDTITGCPNTDSMEVTVNPTVFADAGPNDSICIDNGLFNLGGLPVGGFWSGQGVIDSNGVFDPSVTGVGVFTLTYRYGVQTCRTLDSFELTVNPLPTVYAGPDISHCINDPFITLTAAVPAGGVYSGPGIINQTGIINPRAAGVGVHTIIYTYTHPVTGCVNVDSFELTINDVPTSQFAFDPAAFGCEGPVTVTMIDQSVGAVNYFWDFGNGQSSQQAQPSVTFNSVGAYNVQLVVQNNFGCFDTSAQTFNVYPFPEINGLQALPDEGCVPLRVNFIPSTFNANTLNWDFGDGNVSGPVGTGNIFHTYQDTGFYTVRIIAISNGNCGDTVSFVDTVKVRPRPIADFSWSTNTIPFAFGGEADFTNLSIDAVRYLWQFGDGDTSTQANPTHVYQNLQGNIDVTLITWNVYGCPDTIVQTIFIPEYVKGLWVPNALSPEFGVGEVRVFQPKGVGLDSYSVQIFNTWGELLWQSTALVDGSPTESWDGTFNGEIVPQDVYIWKIEATFLDGTVWQGKEYGEGNFKRIGTVTVIR